MVNFNIELSNTAIGQCKSFAEESAKTQREYRSGGTQIRAVERIETDTRRGKTAEVAVKNFLEQNPFNVTDIELDFGIYPRGVWDKQDFQIGDKHISIKSAKSFSRWLLLETKDINRGDLYNYYIFITVADDYASGTIRGYATKEEILTDPQTLKLKKGECIPNTATRLDADNHARHCNLLHNSEADWIKFSER